MSLEYHLMLEALRTGHGDGRMASRLVEILFLAEFLHEAGYGDGDPERFEQIEAALARCSQRGNTTGDWHITDDDDHVRVAQLLTVHDQQLACAPLQAVAFATERLWQLVAKTAVTGALIQKAA